MTAFSTANPAWVLACCVWVPLVLLAPFGVVALFKKGTQT